MLDVMEQKENRGPKENLGILAGQVAGETRDLLEGQGSQDPKEHRVLMERMVEAEYPEYLVPRELPEQWVSVVLKDKRVLLEEKEIVENLERWVVRVSEVPEVKLENQAPQDLRVDKVTEEIWEIKEAREPRDRLETKDPQVHLVEWEIPDFLEHEARMVHQDYGVNVDPEESKVRLAHRVLLAVKARMAYPELMD